MNCVMKKEVAYIFMFFLYTIACSDKPKNGNASEGQKGREEQGQTFEYTLNAVGNSMADMSYDVTELRVKAGGLVRITLINKGTDASMQHNVVVVKQGTEKDVAMEGMNFKDHNYFNYQNPNVIAGSSITSPGGTTTIEFTAPQAGTYKYI